MKSKLVKLMLIAMIGVLSFGVVFAEEGTTIYDEVDPKFDGNLGDMGTPIAQVLGVIQVIGFIVAIAMVIYIGIKYLTAGAGSKAEVKSTMVPMLIGAALVGLAPTLVNWIFGIFAGSNS